MLINQWILIQLNKDPIMKGLSFTKSKRFWLQFWYSRFWCCHWFRYYIMVRKWRFIWFQFLFQCKYEWCFKCGGTRWRIGTIFVRHNSYEVRIQNSKNFFIKNFENFSRSFITKDWNSPNFTSRYSKKKLLGTCSKYLFIIKNIKNEKRPEHVVAT